MSFTWPTDDSIEFLWLVVEPFGQMLGLEIAKLRELIVVIGSEGCLCVANDEKCTQLNILWFIIGF